MRFSAKRFLGGLLVAGAVGAAALYLAAEAGYDVPFFESAIAAEIIDPDAILTDLDGRRVALDLAPDLEGSEMVAAAGRFVVPAVGLDVPLVYMTITRGVLNPPTLTDAFLVRGTGGRGFETPVPGSARLSGTEPTADGNARTTDGALIRPQILALHSVQGGRAAGNALATIGPDGRAKSALQPGDMLYVGEVAYKVTSVEEQRKEDAALDPAIWQESAAGAERLVVITCLQHPGGPRRAPTNLIIHAVKAH